MNPTTNQQQHNINGGVYYGKIVEFVHKTFGSMWTIDILVFYSNGSDLER